VAPLTVAAAFGVILAAIRFGLPAGDAPLAALAVPVMLVLPSVLAVRLFGVVRA
jgi:hypothetical protein